MHLNSLNSLGQLKVNIFVAHLDDKNTLFWGRCDSIVQKPTLEYMQGIVLHEYEQYIQEDFLDLLLFSTKNVRIL